MMNFEQRILALCKANKWFDLADDAAYEKLSSACSDPSFSTRDIASMIYICSGGNDFYEILEAVDSIRAGDPDTEEVIISSKTLATIQDIFQEELIKGCRSIAGFLTGKSHELEPLQEAFYEYGFHEQFEMLAGDLIREAYGITYRGDGTSF